MRSVRDLAQLQACASGGMRMKIVFWGGSHRCGTTGSMAAVASYLSMQENYRGICVQPKESGSDLERFFRPWEGSTAFREESTYYALEGMDYLIWQEQHHRLDESVVREAAIPLLDGKLFFLPSGSRENSGLYPAQTAALQQQILEKLEAFAELVFIDLGTAKDAMAQQMMMLADVIVVNFAGAKTELSDFFGQPYLWREKVLYLLANYMDDQVYNRENLHRIYRIDRRRICSLPANAGFAHACMHGRVDRFIRHSACTYTQIRNQAFFSELRQTARLILEVAGDE